IVRPILHGPLSPAEPVARQVFDSAAIGEVLQSGVDGSIAGINTIIVDPGVALTPDLDLEKLAATVIRKPLVEEVRIGLLSILIDVSTAIVVRNDVGPVVLATAIDREPNKSAIVERQP